MKTLLILISLFSVQTFAAICSCDAPPSCGAKPPSCFRSVAKDFLGKVFIEETSSKAPKILTFSSKVDSSANVYVGYGSQADGMPFGKYYVHFSSENTFVLMLAPFGGGTPSVVEEFEFEISYSPTHIELQTTEGVLFLLRR